MSLFLALLIVVTIVEGIIVFVPKYRYLSKTLPINLLWIGTFTVIILDWLDILK